MKYIEAKDVKECKFYHCVTYDGDDIVVEYLGNDQFGTGLDYGIIRYVLQEFENLREVRKQYE